MKKRRKRRRCGAALVVVLTLVVGAAWFLHSAEWGEAQGEVEEWDGSQGWTNELTTKLASHGWIGKDSPKIQDVLALVNGDYEDPGATEPAPAHPSVDVATRDVELDVRALQAAQALFYEAEEQGYTGYYLTSGIRSYERQRQLYDEAEDKSYVQKPGHSEHHTGLAMDVAYLERDMKDEDSKELRWLKKNARRYGWILRYPKGKKHITGIAYEPWHFRYVGVPHSYYMEENNMCHEEYVEYLRGGGKYEMVVDGVRYSVWYENVNDGKVRVPEDMGYEVSRDNTGGYVLTGRRD